MDMDMAKFEEIITRAKAHIATLDKDNWDDDDAPGIAAQTIRDAETVVRGIIARAVTSEITSKLPVPFFAPVVDGTIDLGWGGKDWRFIVNVEPGGIVCYYAYRKDANQRHKEMERKGEFEQVNEDAINCLHEVLVDILNPTGGD